MEKKQFVALLYVFGIVPMMYAVSNHFLSSLGRVGFGGLNIIALVVFAILFTPNNTPLTNKKKKASIMILGGILIVSSVIGGLVRFGDQASSRLYNSVLAPAPSTGGIVMTVTTGALVDTGSILQTGTILTGTDTGTQPDYIKPVTSSGTTIVDTFQKTETKPNIETSTTITTILPTKGTLSYAQVIPYLVSQYKLKSTGKGTTFRTIASTSSLYSAFAIAAQRGMIGTDINPGSKVSCNTYMVLKGIAAGWKVDYKSGDPFSAYRTAAYNKSEVNGCTAGAFVTKATL